ncbi:hypothetical protein B296_00005433 [Ensete ventricosum]|uniref:Uncharacterized protein n=1 Tax=Ensete ventricosum TaxID=4639 RepID=A0A426XVV4_ENSVE|nr:hypothetical protein B296_00005433 [Ensete ventricosum]
MTWMEWPVLAESYSEDIIEMRVESYNITTNDENAPVRSRDTLEYPNRLPSNENKYSTLPIRFYLRVGFLCYGTNRSAQRGLALRKVVGRDNIRSGFIPASTNGIPSTKIDVLLAVFLSLLFELGTTTSYLSGFPGLNEKSDRQDSNRSW